MGQAQTKPGGSAGSGVVNNQNGEVASRVPSTTTSQSSQQQPIAYAESPVPGSPVTFSPQLPSEPFSFARDDSVSTTHHLQSKAVATVFSWGAGGNSVELEGSFDNWSSRHVMHKAGKDHSLVKLLSPGVYQYKFIVDGQWRHDPNQPCVYDDQGNINNVLEVQEYIAEDLSGMATFEPPPSPTSSYQNPMPSSDDFMKEPPSVPPQLQLSLLNVPTNSLGVNASAASNLDAAGGSRSTPMDSLPRPQHVILNHMYSQRTSGSGVMVIGSTTRYKSKYVTTVLYRARSKGDADGDGSGVRSNMLHRIVREGRGDGDAMETDVTSTAAMTM